jgi:hypothetical protein
MNLYTVSLFVHMIGLISLFGGFVLLQNSGRRLRAATTWEDARPWLDLLQPISGMLLGGGVLVLASGLSMARQQWTYATPWVVVGMIAALLAISVGPLAIGRRLLAIRRVAGNSRGVLSPEGRAMLSSASLWSSIFAMNGLMIGVVWLMSTKPGWTASIAIPLTLAVIGAAIGVRLGGRQAAARRDDSWAHPMTRPPSMARPSRMR